MRVRGGLCISDSLTSLMEDPFPALFIITTHFEYFLSSYKNTCLMCVKANGKKPRQKWPPFDHNFMKLRPSWNYIHYIRLFVSDQMGRTHQRELNGNQRRFIRQAVVGQQQREQSIFGDKLTYTQSGFKHYYMLCSFWQSQVYVSSGPPYFSLTLTEWKERQHGV